MDIRKIRAMLGFSIKSGNIIYGLDNIEASRKPIYLVLADQSISSKTLENLKRLASFKRAKLITLEASLEDMVCKTNCKVVAILDKNMSENIIMNAGSGGGSILD